MHSRYESANWMANGSTKLRPAKPNATGTQEPLGTIEFILQKMPTRSGPEWLKRHSNMVRIYIQPIVVKFESLVFIPILLNFARSEVVLAISYGHKRNNQWNRAVQDAGFEWAKKQKQTKTAPRPTRTKPNKPANANKTYQETPHFRGLPEKHKLKRTLLGPFRGLPCETENKEKLSRDLLGTFSGPSGTFSEPSRGFPWNTR